MFIWRFTNTIKLKIKAGEAISEAFNFSQWAGGQIKTDVTIGNGKIGFQGSFDGGETWDGIFDPTSNQPFEIVTVAGKSRIYPLPEELFSSMLLRLWSQSAGVNVNQTVDQNFVLNIKS